MSNHNSSGDDDEVIGDGVDYSSFFESEPFNTLDDAFNWCINVAVNNGFNIIKWSSQRSKKTGLFTKWWICDRFADPRNEETNAVRDNTSSKKCGCTFKLRVGERFVTDDSGSICGSCWVLRVANGFHNHEMTNYAEGHRRRAAFDADEIEYIEKQVLAQVPPAKISLGLHLRTPEKPRPAIKQLYNIGSKIRSEMRAGRNPAQHMLTSATEAGYVQYREINSERAQLTHIFMAHPEAIRMYRSYKFVVGIDSTYNTNTYEFPLVEMIEMTPTNQNFTIAYAIMESERKEDYVWMLEKLRTLLPNGESPNVIVTDRELSLMDVIPLVFPRSRNILCVWHVNRAVEKRVNDTCKYMRRRNTSSSRPDPEVDMCKFFTKHRVTWLVHGEKFLRPHTNTSTHYDNTSTSRVEAAHSVLKEWLHSAHISDDTVWARYHALMAAQHVEIKKALEDSRSKGKKDKYVENQQVFNGKKRVLFFFDTY
ncbi:hypothetical protein RND81_11G085200 [Saponaria officinalis]|uniref:MULE transposase domain-containing protein n=1 Tax=Saponaria officinalis TaxID=3572 RepID=A0AAW1HJD4_SAPOF